MPFLHFFHHIFERLGWHSRDFGMNIFPKLFYVLWLAGVYISLKSCLKEKCEGVKTGDLGGYQYRIFWHEISHWSWRKLDCWIRSMSCFDLVFDKRVVYCRMLNFNTRRQCCHIMPQCYLGEYTYFVKTTESLVSRHKATISTRSFDEKRCMAG